MDSRSSRPTQPDTDQQGSFRVKLRVTHVVVQWETFPPSRELVSSCLPASFYPPVERALRAAGLLQ